MRKVIFVKTGLLFADLYVKVMYQMGKPMEKWRRKCVSSKCRKPRQREMSSAESILGRCSCEFQHWSLLRATKQDVDTALKCDGEHGISMNKGGTAVVRPFCAKAWRGLFLYA